MENLKVKISSEAESKEVQGYFEELGAVCCSGLERNKNVNFLFMNNGFVTACKLQENFDKSKCKEITLPELRDIVVLKRNDRNDRTHTDQDNWSWFISSNGTGYVFGAGNANGLHQWDESSLNMVDLKPIGKKEMKEYLRKNSNGTYSYIGPVHTDHVHDLMIEIPVGAVKAYLNNSKTINFVNADDDYMNSLTDGNWVDTHRGKHDLCGHELIWQRNQEPKQAEFLVKTDSGYVLQVLDENAGGEDVVRIPDGAEIAIEYTDGRIYFWTGKNSCKWVDGELIKSKYPDCLTSKQFLDEWPNSKVLWKRETLNDQVASAEEYREMISNAAIAQSCGGGSSRNASSQCQSEFPLNNYELNHRVAKAFNAVRGTDLNEDDVNYIRELINLTVSHYGERK